MTSSGRHTRLQRLPLRMRLVAGFSAAITLVLVAAGAFVYWRVRYALDLRLNTDASQAADALRPLVQADGTLQADAGTAGTDTERLYQVYDEQGRLLSFGSGVGSHPLISAGTARAALRGPVRREVGRLLPRSDHPFRVLATPVSVSSTVGRDVLVVAVRRDQRDEALRELLAQLTLAGLGALVVSAVVGERLAKAALAPVERYRADAVAVAGGQTGVRLDVPMDREDEVTRLGVTLNAMLDALEETVQREQRFTADASHELRTPLTLLSTRVQLALSRARTGEEYQQVLRELGHDIDSLNVLASDLLRLTTAQQASDATASTGLSELVGLVIALASDYGDAVVVELEEQARGRVPFSAQQLRQVLTNLVDNGHVHGTSPVTLNVGMRAGQALVVTVTDAGESLAPEFTPHATDRFARQDDARNRPGAGLGLSLVAALLGAAGGELRLCRGEVHYRYSRELDAECRHPATGTTATVLLPVADALPG